MFGPRASPAKCAFALVVLAIGCSSAEPPVPTDGCQPITRGIDCLLPYPSDHFRRDGLVAFPEAAQIQSKDGPIDILLNTPVDGYSLGTPILALFPNGVAASSLVGHTDDVSRSLTADSPTLIVNTRTMQPVLHFAELDPLADTDDKRALFLRPMRRLEPSTRYIVAIRNLEASAGGRVPAPNPFARLRDGVEGDAEIDAIRDRYETEIFAPLSPFGARADLQLAWDFTTRDEAALTQDMFDVRNDVVRRLETDKPQITIKTVQTDVSERIAIRIEASAEVPLYLDRVEAKDARLVRDANGRVQAQGSAQVDFTVLVPPIVATGTVSNARIVQFGHGFFGDRTEAARGHVIDIAEKKGWVVIATDWWGMTWMDRSVIIERIFNDPRGIMEFTDRVHQAMANYIAVSVAAQSTLTEVAELKRPGGELMYDASSVYFYGLSQGHILGGTYAALSPNITHNMLGVGGANFSLMMFRARPFSGFLVVLRLQVPDDLEIQKFAALSQLVFDRIDPITYAPFVLQRKLPNSPDRRVLMHAGIGDASVTPLAAHLHARSIGIPHVVPAPRMIPAMDTVMAPAPSGLVEFDFGVTPTIEAVAPPDNSVHGALRDTATAQDQVDRFFAPSGQVEQVCDGACDPE